MNIIKNYIEYLKDNPKGYWFKRKLYGWGWTPATWQGWAVTLLAVGLIIANAIRVGEQQMNDADTIKQILLPTFILVLVLVVVSYRKGEKPKWTWGRPKSKNSFINSQESDIT